MHADPHLRGPRDGLYRQAVVSEDFQDVSVAGRPGSRVMLKAYYPATAAASWPPAR